MRDIVGSASKFSLAAVPPSYKAILELDCKLREMVLPPALNAFIQPEDPSACVSAGVYMKSCLISQCRSVSMIFIHRSFFAQALLHHPENPLQSPYATSFLATYRAASTIIRGTNKILDRFPELLLR